MTRPSFDLETCYHELGHIVGYILSESDTESSLGGIKRLTLSFNINSVSGNESLYNIPTKEYNPQESISTVRMLISGRTRNIKRTLSYFIEVMSGCIFESMIRGVHIESCFSAKGNGKKDINNMASIRSISHFDWTFKEMNQLAAELRTLYEKYNILQRLEPIATELTERVNNSTEPCQMVTFENEALENLLKKVLKEIQIPAFIKGYLLLLHNYTQYYKNKPI